MGNCLHSVSLHLSKGDNASSTVSSSEALPQYVYTDTKLAKNNQKRGSSNSSKTGTNESSARETIKLLFLGAGESGKSTLFKQLRILYGTPFTVEEEEFYAIVIRSNAVVAMRKLLELKDKIGDGLESDDEKELCDDVKSRLDLSSFERSQSQEDLSEDFLPVNELLRNRSRKRVSEEVTKESILLLKYWRDMQSLWSKKIFNRDLWLQRNLVNIIDGHKHYLNSLERIAASDYVPTVEDVLLSRLQTTRAVLEHYFIDGVDFEMVDVGGQRSERKKWMRLVDSLDGVIFVAALSEYDQRMSESRSTNRLMEAIELLWSTCNSKPFANASVILFLNKMDVFAEKIGTSDIRDVPEFSDFTGKPGSVEDGLNYFTEKFSGCMKIRNMSYIHVTNATDTDNMEFVFDASRSLILSQVCFLNYFFFFFFCLSVLSTSLEFKKVRILRIRVRYHVKKFLSLNS